MNTIQITEAVIKRIKRDYYLIPRRETEVNFDKEKFVTKVTEFVCEFCGISLESLTSESRLRYLAEARYFVYHIVSNQAQEFIKPEIIGSVINRDRTTILAGINKKISLRTVDKEFNTKLEQCEAAYLERFGKPNK